MQSLQAEVCKRYASDNYITIIIIAIISIIIYLKTGSCSTTLQSQFRLHSPPNGSTRSNRLRAREKEIQNYYENTACKYLRNLYPLPRIGQYLFSEPSLLFVDDEIVCRTKALELIRGHRCTVQTRMAPQGYSGCIRQWVYG